MPKSKQGIIRKGEYGHKTCHHLPLEKNSGCKQESDVILPTTW